MRAPSLAGRNIALALTLCLAAPAYGESLQEAVVQTLNSNPDVLIDVARRLSTGEGLPQAQSGYMPRIDVVYGRGRSRSDNSSTLATYGGPVGQLRYDRSLTLTQMLFDGFATANDVERNYARITSASHKLAATSEQIGLRAIEAYLEVLRNQEVVALTQDNLSVHERTFDQIKLRAASGVGRKADLDQIEARLALARSNLTAAEGNLEVAAINYRMIVGSKPGALVKPDPPSEKLIPPTPDAAIKEALGNSRILKSGKADIEAAKAQSQSARSVMFPRVDLELSTSKNNLLTAIDISSDSNRSATVKLRYTLFKGFADVSHISETRYLIQEAEEIMHRTERQIEQSIRLSWNAYSSARERLPFLIKHSESAQLTRDAYSKQFGLGQRTLLDLLDTENEAFTASSNYLNGQYVELFSRYRVLTDIGLMFETINVPHRDETKLLDR